MEYFIMDTIWILIFIGYAIGLIPIAYFGITGTWEMIEFQNRMAKQERIRPGQTYTHTNIERVDNSGG